MIDFILRHYYKLMAWAGLCDTMRVTNTKFYQCADTVAVSLLNGDVIVGEILYIDKSNQILYIKV